jgi:hypothetical protein
LLQSLVSLGLSKVASRTSEYQCLAALAELQSFFSTRSPCQQLVAAATGAAARVLVLLQLLLPLKL